MKRILSWCLSAPVLGTLGVAALCAVVWWLGPLLAFGTGTEVHHPLAGVAPRAALVGLMALAWAAWLTVSDSFFSSVCRKRPSGR